MIQGSKTECEEFDQYVSYELSVSITVEETSLVHIESGRCENSDHACALRHTCIHDPKQ